MDNLRPDELFENDSFDISYPDDGLTERKSESAEYIKVNKHPVLTFQLVIVLCVTLFLFVVKFCSADLFSVIIKSYETEVSKSIIYDGDSSFDLTGLFSTDDEV